MIWNVFSVINHVYPFQECICIVKVNNKSTRQLKAFTKPKRNSTTIIIFYVCLLFQTHNESSWHPDSSNWLLRSKEGRQGDWQWQGTMSNCRQGQDRGSNANTLSSGWKTEHTWCQSFTESLGQTVGHFPGIGEDLRVSGENNEIIAVWKYWHSR